MSVGIDGYDTKHHIHGIPAPVRVHARLGSHWLGAATMGKTILYYQSMW